MPPRPKSPVDPLNGYFLQCVLNFAEPFSDVQSMGEKAHKFRQAAARILLATSENVEARRLIEIFNEYGFNTHWVTNIPEAKKWIRDWKPRVVISNLLLTGGSCMDLLDYIKKEPTLNDHEISTIVLSSHKNPENLEEALKRGARDYLMRPFMHQELLNRVILQCREPLSVDEEAWSNVNDTGIDELLAYAVTNEKIEEVTHKITKSLAKKINSVRCSLIRTITTSEGLVFASSDDANIAGLRINLSGYPEVQLVANTKKMIAINDLGSSRALKHIQNQVKSIQFSAMIVAPVLYKGRFFGVLSARLPQSTKTVNPEHIRMVSMSAKVLSLCLSARSTEELGHFGLISAS